MESIEKYMQEQSGIKAEFDSLCYEYGLRKGSYEYVSLLTIFANRRGGGFFTHYESLSDNSILELAKMLKQLSFSGGAFSFIVGGIKEDYTSPLLVEVLKKSLEKALQMKVDKVKGEGVVGDRFLLKKPSGKGRLRGYYVTYPEGCTPQEEGFSSAELDAIISFEKGIRVEVEKMRGNVRGYTTPSRNPELGELVLSLINYLPEEWNDATRNAFLADFLQCAGFLNFKGSAWLAKFSEKDKAEKDREVRNWILSFKKREQG